MTRNAGRPYEFPDPNDRSVNEPSTIAERDAVLGLYNQANPGNSYQAVSDTVRQWFKEAAKKNGWTSVEFIDQKAVLTATVILQQPT